MVPSTNPLPLFSPGQSYVKGGLPIKIYYPLQGFLRSYEGPHEAHTQVGY